MFYWIALSSVSRLMTVILLLAAWGCAWAAEIAIYVNPTGNDARKGSSEVDAVATIQRAMKLAEAVPQGTERVKIFLLPGVYLAQRFETAGHPDQVPMLITSGGGGRAVFDGNGDGVTWMILRPGRGHSANITIDGVDVRNYVNAINVTGDRDNSARWAGGLEIRNNKFSHIGNIARIGAKPSTAVIRLVNADHNVIAGNEFTHFRYNKSCALLHAIYVAHDSTDNLIEGNLFSDACGDAIRFRDGSDNNVVRNNSFIDAWARNPVSDWFCNKDRRGDCTKVTKECPSLNNLIEGNKVISRELPPTDIFFPWGSELPVGCPIGMRAIIR
jgi:parallel beta-helix repeat protein